MSDEVYMHDDIEMADSDDELDDDDVQNDPNSMIAEQGNEGTEIPEEDVAIARRKAIQEIMRDKSLSDEERRMRIQNLMSGGRTEVAPPPAPILLDQESSTCVHYERNCSIVAPCCNRVFGCRVCHDELSLSGHPPMDRFAIREVVCKKCNIRQPAS
jgi:CHY zinc finger